MVTKAKSLRYSWQSEIPNRIPIFQVPQTVKFTSITPKRHFNDYVQQFCDINLKKTIYPYLHSSSSKLRTISPSPIVPALNLTQPGTQKLKQFKDYLKNYVRIKNVNASPILKVKNPLRPSEISTKKPSERIAGTCKHHRERTAPIRRGRPARFLSQEDIENSLRSKERGYRTSENKEDMRILVENNQTKQLERFEIEKIYRIYNASLKKPSIIKNNDWGWTSPQLTPRRVKFQE